MFRKKTKPGCQPVSILADEQLCTSSCALLTYRPVAYDSNLSMFWLRHCGENAAQQVLIMQHDTLIHRENFYSHIRLASRDNNKLFKAAARPRVESSEFKYKCSLYVSQKQPPDISFILIRVDGQFRIIKMSVPNRLQTENTLV